MAIRQVSFAAPQQQQSPLVQALAPRDPRQMLAMQALQEGSSTAPVQSIGEGLTRLAQGALGGWFAGRQKREGEEASGRLADALLSSLPEDQRTGPLAMALRDPNVAPGLIPGMLQQMATRREQWAPDPTGMFQVNSVTGERRPLETVERHRAIAEAGRDPYASVRVVPGQDGQPPMAVDLRQVMGGGSAPPGQVAQAIIGRESGGNPTAQNPMSSATGAGQFLDQTWLDMAPRLGVDPQLLARAQQGDPQARQQILALRNDPQLSARATEMYAQQNGQRLQAAGIPTTPENLYLAHFLGPEGAQRFLSTQPNAPVSQAVGPQAFAANRQVFTRDGRELTVGEVYGSIRQDIQRRMGGAQTAQPQPATEGPQYPPGVRPLVGGGQAALPRRDAFRMESDLHERLLGNPTVRAARDVVPIFSSMVNSAGRDDIVSDIDLVYGLAKIMDPNSVVRESEQRIVVTSSQGLTDQMIGWINGLNGGRRLQPEARQNILATAQQRVTGVVEAANNLRNEVGEFATGYGLNRDRVMGRAFVLPEWSRPAPAASAAPPPAPATPPAPLPPQTPVPQPGVGRGVQVPIPQQPAIVPETQPAPPAVPPRGAIPREQILRELRNRGIQVQ